MTLERIERIMTAIFPKEEGKKSGKSDQAAADEEDSGPSAIAAGAQPEGQQAKGGKGKGKKQGKGKGKGRANNTGVDNNNTGYGGGGGGDWRQSKVCFVCNKPGHSYRGVRENGTAYHTPEEISAARAAEYVQRAPKASGGKGGGSAGWQARSGGAVESAEVTKAELEYQLLEARIKLLEARNAAASTSSGWDA